MDCNTFKEDSEEGYKMNRRCDQREFMDAWSSLVENTTKVSSDDLIADYNEIKYDALRSLISLEESILKNNNKRNGVRWAKAINVRGAS